MATNRSLKWVEGELDLAQPVVNFCSSCGGSIVHRMPAGDNLVRAVCNVCGTIHYQNPRVVAGCIPERNGQVLLCRRALEPRRGYWTLPAGYMENGETLQDAAARECLEEAQARVAIGTPLAIVHVLHLAQVHTIFRARMLDAHFGVGAESSAVALFNEAQIPWAQLAFPGVSFALRCYFEDRRRAVESLHFGDFSLAAASQ